MLLRIVVYLLCAAALVGCRQPVPEPVAVEQPAAPAEEVVAAPSRIVLFVGDGMGIGFFSPVSVVGYIHLLLG